MKRGNKIDTNTLWKTHAKNKTIHIFAFDALLEDWEAYSKVNWLIGIDGCQATWFAGY